MPVLTTRNSLCHQIASQLKKPYIITVNSTMENHESLRPRSANYSNQQSAQIRRRSLNISHFNALQNAVSNLARIDDFHLEELGDGFFSDVFKVTHKLTGKVMVLKRNKSTNTKMNILREVQLMNRLSHPNILKFKGVCVHEGQLHALTEYINGGDLEKFLLRKKTLLSWKQRVQLALDVARGIKYLHSVGIFHRDLSAQNCLVRVSENGKGKVKYNCIVADLGLAEKIPCTAEDEQRLTIVGTPYIMAPEVLTSKPYNEKADSFSFGLLVCQLIARVTSDPEELPRRQDFGLACDLFHKMVTASPLVGNESVVPSQPPDAFLQLAYDCCQLTPSLRPSFNEITARLEELMTSMKTRRVERSSSVISDNVRTIFPMKQNAGKNDEQKKFATDEDDDRTAKSTENFKKRNSSSSSVRLSRSFSDISWELLSHAANMAASSTTDEVVDDPSDEFSNPFAALKHLNEGRTKLKDEPSLGLLELTFDLTSSENLKSVWNPTSEYVTKKQRSKSVYSYGSTPRLEELPHSPTSPRLVTFRRRENHCSRIPSSRVGSASEDSVSGCFDCHYQRALNRAMVLSPLANNLASWWCTRHRELKSTLECRRQSLATMMSVLSSSIKGTRRCISLPDLSKISSLFHPADGATIFNKNISPRTMRSKTANEVLFPPKETIWEESETDLIISKSSSFGNIQTLKPEFGPEALNDSPPLARRSDLKADQENSTVFPFTKTAITTEDRRTNGGSDVNVPHSPSLPSFSPDSLSSFRTAEVSRRNCIPNSNIPSNTVQCKRNPNIPDPPNSVNRDSGYEEDHHSSGVLSPGCEFHHLSWKIPEEVVSSCLS